MVVFIRRGLVTGYVTRPRYFCRFRILGGRSDNRGAYVSWTCGRRPLRFIDHRSRLHVPGGWERSLNFYRDAPRLVCGSSWGGCRWDTLRCERTSGRTRADVRLLPLCERKFCEWLLLFSGSYKAQGVPGIPEPGTIGLVATGLGGIVGLIR